MGGHDWYWDVNGSFGINKARQSFTGNVRADRVAQAIGPIADCTAPCVPLNLFGGAGSITQAMLDFIGFTEHDKSHQHLYDFTGNISGTVADLPAGPLDIAVGVEHRHQSASFTPDPIVSAGLGADIPAVPASGQLQRERNLRRGSHSGVEGRARRLFARGEWRGPLLALFDGWREGDLYDQRPVEAGSRRALPRRLLDRVPRADDRRAQRRKVALRPSAGRSVHQRRERLVHDRRTRPRQLHRQWRSAAAAARRRSLCRAAGQLPVLTRAIPT